MNWTVVGQTAKSPGSFDCAGTLINRPTGRWTIGSRQPEAGECGVSLGRIGQGKPSAPRGRFVPPAMVVKLGMARIFITGSSTGLGMMSAQLLVEQGHRVVGDVTSIAGTKRVAGRKLQRGLNEVGIVFMVEAQPIFADRSA
jgi:hypothetical protein